MVSWITRSIGDIPHLPNLPTRGLQTQSKQFGTGEKDSILNPPKARMSYIKATLTSSSVDLTTTVQCTVHHSSVRVHNCSQTYKRVF